MSYLVLYLIIGMLIARLVESGHENTNGYLFIVFLWPLAVIAYLWIVALFFIEDWL